MRSRKSYKKGQLPMDMIVVVLVLFAFGIVGVISTMMANNINDDLQLDPDFSNESKAASNLVATSMSDWYDNGFVFILVMLWIGLLISSWFIDTHPAFFIITLILVIIVLAVGGLIAEGFLDITADADMGSTASGMTKMMWVMNHWLIISIVIAFSTMIALYAKFNGG